MTVRYVAARCAVVTVIGLASIVGGCTASPSPGSPPSGATSPSQASLSPADCTDRITGSVQTSVALALAQPGATVCLSDGVHNAELKVTTSGTPEQPITIIAEGATIRSMDVKADYVVIQGLTLRDGDGLTMAGRGLVARDNVIYNAAESGLACLDCVDTLIEFNTVQRADGTGIYLAGERITVRNNTVSESVLRTQDDADGIRFFGVGHRLTGNTIKDIKASGYDRGGPHTDCFQTYNNASDPPTYDIIIADNECTNVDVQCLIATAKEDGARSSPEGQTSIVFERNTAWAPPTARWSATP